MKIIALVCLLSVIGVPGLAQVPANAEPVPWGKGWECSRGFYDSGRSCRAVVLPEHAVLDFTGHRWVCDDGFLRRGQRCVVLSEATDLEIRRMLIAESLAAYSGSCPCPCFTDRAGRSCGRRSAYSRPGGYSPLRYPTDVSVEQVQEVREKNKP